MVHQSGNGNGESRRRVGARLRALRERREMSRAEAADRAGVSRFELASYERGHRRVPECVVASLARAYGVSPGEVVPSRSPSRLRVAEGEMASGEVVRPIPPGATPDEVLDEYLDFIRDLRHAENLEDLSLRDHDLEVLADALGGSPDEIERRLVELIHCTQDEARAIRRALLKRRLVVPAAGFMLGIGGFGSALASAAGQGKPSAVISDTSERARSIELDTSPVTDPSPPAEPAPNAPAPPAPPAADPAPAPDRGTASEPVTRSGSGVGDDWAEVIPPVTISPDEPAD